jgi:hypothetical protein
MPQRTETKSELEASMILLNKAIADADVQTREEERCFNKMVARYNLYRAEFYRRYKYIFDDTPKGL